MDANGLFVAGSGPATGKSAIALGLHDLLARRAGRLGVYRPVVARPDAPDPVLRLLAARGAIPAAGVGHAGVHAGEEFALEEIVARFHALAATCDAVLAVGSDYGDAGAPTEFSFNARVAAN